MTALAPYTVLATFILFCRIGACLMLMPGFSSPRVPMRVRLFVAIAITLALAPLLVDGVRDSIPDGSAVGVLGLIFSETLIGALIGLMGRMFQEPVRSIMGVEVPQQLDAILDGLVEK